MRSERLRCQEAFRGAKLRRRRECRAGLSWPECFMKQEVLSPLRRRALRGETNGVWLRLKIHTPMPPRALRAARFASFPCRSFQQTKSSESAMENLKRSQFCRKTRNPETSREARSGASAEPEGEPTVRRQSELPHQGSRLKRAAVIQVWSEN